MKSEFSRVGQTIRMRVAPDRTLNGYIFSDDDHARQWLSRYADRENVELERVLVGPVQQCPTCGGRGSTQSVKKLQDITLHELLKEADDP